MPTNAPAPVARRTRTITRRGSTGVNGGDVIVGIEPDDDAAAVLGVAWARAQQRGARLVVCHVAAPGAAADDVDARRGAIDAWIDRACPSRDAVTVELRTGDAAEQLIALGAERHASLLVVGAAARRDGWFARTFFPTVTTAVARTAACPVLVVRHNHGTGRILVATDLSDPELPTLRAAAQAAGASPSQITVLHCIPPMSTMAVEVEGDAAAAGVATMAAEAAARARLDAWMAQAGLGDEATARIAHGPPAATILAEATTLRADLIVIGTRGRTGADRLFMGSVAEHVVQDALGHVLVVRLNDADEATRVAAST